MASSCPTIVQDGTAIMVDEAYDKYSSFAQQAYTLAISQVQNLGDFTLPMLAPNVTFNIDDSVYGFKRPTAPTLPDLVYNDPGALPDAPALTPVAVTFDSAPDAPNNPAPALPDYAPPADFAVAAPSAPPVLPAITMPELPTLDLPALPTLDSLQIPDAPTLTLPSFEGIRPNNTLTNPAQSWSFTPTDYSSALLDKTSNQISVMLDGGTGLPAAVAQALRDRANAAVDAEEQRQVAQAKEEYAAMGWEEPPGVLKKRVAQARQAGQNQRAAANRDIYIQEQQVALENLRFAVQQGVALESMLFQGHTEMMRIGLESARAALDTSIQLFNAQVSLFNAEQQAYAIDAQVYRDRVQAQLATLELYRSQIEAERARGEINLQRVQIYSEQVRALTVQADIYRAQVEGQRAQAEANRASTEAYRAEVQGYAEQVRAYEVQWEGFAHKIESNSSKARIYGTIQDAFATRVRAWSETQQAKIAGGNFGIALNDQSLKVWRGKVDNMLARYTAERDRLASLVSVATAKVDLYRAEAGVETAAADANLRMLLAGLEREKERTSIALKNAELSINQMIENGRLLLTSREGVARIAAQLAASSMSAVNFSAGISSSLSQGYGCHTSFNYSGAVDTTTP